LPAPVHQCDILAAQFTMSSNDHRRDPIKLIVAGAGVAGLALHAALAGDSRFAVTILDRSTRSMSGGAAIILWGNAVAALRRIGLEGPILAASVELEHSEFMTAAGGLLCRLPIGEWSRRAGAPTVVIRRADLVAILAARLGDGTLRLGAALRDFSQRGGKVTVALQDGAELLGDALVGADGLRSTVRARLVADEPEELPYEAWVGICPVAPIDLEGGRSMAWLGSGLRFCAARLTDGAAFWYATVNSGTHQAATRLELLELFRGWSTPVPDLIAATSDGDLIKSAIYDRGTSDRWGVGSVTLVGDAAHPSTPDLGQGACQAVEGALLLAGCLQAGGTVADAFRSYERLRMPRLATINRLCRLTWASSAVEGTLRCAIRDKAMQVGLPLVAREHLRWILAGQQQPAFA
jgi:2-polyprenyl-6-methoxyphenol hydroxylase-like FAD-dependent oxidoreductase